jgi:tetratricopeptide (TPR) repeat protein
MERERARYDDGMRRLDPEQLVRLGNAAYAAGLCLLMLGELEEAADWLERASARWRESWEYATPTSWGRPIGVVKAALIARDDESASAFAAWALGLGCTEAESPIGRYAATLALLVERRDPEAVLLAKSLCESDDFPPAVAEALAGIAAHSRAQYGSAVEQVLSSFESREEYLEDVPVADTVIVLQALAGLRGLAVELDSPLLPS